MRATGSGWCTADERHAAIHRYEETTSLRVAVRRRQCVSRTHVLHTYFVSLREL